MKNKPGFLECTTGSIIKEICSLSLAFSLEFFFAYVLVWDKPSSTNKQAQSFTKLLKTFRIKGSSPSIVDIQLNVHVVHVPDGRNDSIFVSCGNAGYPQYSNDQSSQVNLGFLLLIRSHLLQNILQGC